MTCDQLINSLTQPQRRAFDKLTKGRAFAPKGSSPRRPYDNLVKLGLAARSHCALGITFVLSDLGKICNGPIVLDVTSSP